MVAPLQILSIPPVTIEQDPVLSAAQPVTMASAATDMAFMARVLFNTSSTIGTAVLRLGSQWSGEGAEAFKSAGSPLSGSVAGAAEALFGGAQALAVLAQGIGDAQRLAIAAQLLAERANFCLVLLQRSVRETELHGPGGGRMLLGFAPTGAQIAAAQQILANQEQARRLMAQAHRTAQTAWESARRAFDLVTSQSPKVGAVFDNVNIGVYNREISGLGMMGMAALAFGALGGGDGDDDEGGDDPVSFDAAGDGDDRGAGSDPDGADDPIDEELTVLDAQADARVTVYGIALDQDIADDYNTPTDGSLTIATSAQNEEADELRNELPPFRTDPTQLRKKFKHGPAFGITGRSNAASCQRYGEALASFVDAGDTTRVLGTLHKIPAILNYNSATALVVVQDPAGTFITGWKMTPGQLQRVIQDRSLGGG